MKTKFIEWYFNDFCLTTMFDSMLATHEDSPYHREKNVGVHTNMVVGHYMSLAPQEWTKEETMGALVCAFHDVGKPKSEESFNYENEIRRKYTGHELISARLWENYAITHYDKLQENFQLTYQDIFLVGWMIQYHLPYCFKKPQKIDKLISTVTFENNRLKEIFKNVLIADSRGRISDDYEIKKQKTLDWIQNFHNKSYVRQKNDSTKKCFILIGASGSGKTSYIKTLTDEYKETINIYSFDQIRLDRYSNNYECAFKASCEDPEFNSICQKELNKLLAGDSHIIIDNTNLSDKRRYPIITEAKRKGFQIHGLYFMNNIENISNNQKKRTDKYIKKDVYQSQYMRLAYPSLSDYDLLDIVHDRKTYPIIK